MGTMANRRGALPDFGSRLSLVDELTCTAESRDLSATAEAAGSPPLGHGAFDRLHDRNHGALDSLLGSLGDLADLDPGEAFFAHAEVSRRRLRKVDGAT